MFEEIVQSIAEVIALTFSGEIPVYREEMPQEYETPCFMINVIKSALTPKLHPRYLLECSLDILYFPAEGNQEPIFDMQSAAEKLLWATEYVTVSDGIIRGSKANFRTEDGVLHFMVDYNVVIRRERLEPELMRALEQKIGGAK